MNKKDEAVKMYNSGFNCSQSVVSAFCEDLNLDRKTALKISAGFGGGCRKGEVCGAVSGAVMALGLKYGYYVEGDPEAKEYSNGRIIEFMKKFEELNGTVRCKELLGYDPSVESELAIIKEKGLNQIICTKVIKDAAEIVGEMLSD